MMDLLLPSQSGVARLPVLLWQQWWLAIGWSVVMAWLGVWLTHRAHRGIKVQVGVSIALAAWVCLPGAWGGAYWLGLAFQAPSLATVFLCALLLARQVRGPRPAQPWSSVWPSPVLFLAWLGVLVGWALLLDTLGLWPDSLYNWGFSAIAPAIALVIVMLPWIVVRARQPDRSVAWTALAVLLFVVLRLPTGNLFDALLDPGLWCFLQFALIQQWRHRAKTTGI